MKENSKNIAVYRCVIDDYDLVLNEIYKDKFTDYFLFTNNPNLNIYPYKTILVDSGSKSAAEMNRLIKIIIPEVLKKYEITIYLDGNIAIIGNINDLIKNFKRSKADIGLFQHPYHNSLQEDVELCIKNNKCDEQQLRGEVAYYSSSDLLPRPRFSDNSVIIRKKHSLTLSNAMNEWFSLVSKFSGRDQISLPIIRKKHNLNEYFFDFSPRTKNNKYFLIFPHNKKLSSDNFILVLGFYLRFFVKMVKRFFIKIKKNDTR